MRHAQVGCCGPDSVAAFSLLLWSAGSTHEYSIGGKRRQGGNRFRCRECPRGGLSACPPLTIQRSGVTLSSTSASRNRLPYCNKTPAFGRVFTLYRVLFLWNDSARRFGLPEHMPEARAPRPQGRAVKTGRAARHGSLRGNHCKAKRRFFSRLSGHLPAPLLRPRNETMELSAAP